ncbi:hypothetical protein F5J12DRAFT_962446 [Pisolithus orientalis]|uniref:uncharacterized protein n=1 Tax=Pisolithus orientalis TaxID=936130 RepID=UPI002225147F|nr:uncharacterized protein F5J12DRAFT_962446 [Pisolithus orientalis]KAI5994586.1 hypothetical protein F5J12DRAFT_962446 [Pisolithus orientalis]
MTRFQWENLEQFISLVNLLSLRNDGQLQPGKKRITKTSTSVGTTKLLGMARKTNSSNIFWTASRYPGEGVKTSLLVARNHGFQKLDVIFCGKLERLLADIGASVQEETDSSIREVKRTELWKELVCYNQPRLDKDANRLCTHLRVFKTSGSLDSILSYNDSECRTFCDDHRIGPYSEATHEAYMKVVQERILEPDNILCSGDSTAKRRRLTECTHSIRRMRSLWIFLLSFPKVSAGHRLLDIRSSDRLRSCYYMLVNAALKIPEFAQLTIVLVKNLRPRVCPSTLPPLTDAMKFFGGI